MDNFFSSLSKIIHSSILLTVLLFIFLSFGVGGFDIDKMFWSWLFRYMHVVAGIMWIGLLWYFNFVQVPNMSKITDEQKPAITKVIAPSALFWFRWAALITVVTGLIVAYLNQVALDYAVENKVAAFWSTSRNELWVKGATSGDILDLLEIRVNCEQNSVLYMVRPRGQGACHTKDGRGLSRKSCYYRRLENGSLTFIES